MTSVPDVRVRYYERQFLRTQDFRDEQAYHLALGRRHNIAHHSWGIVFGLELEVDAEGRPFIRPGMAVDGYGRELALPERRDVDTGLFDARDSDELDVALVYAQSAVGAAPPPVRGCDTADRSADRIRELPELRLEAHDPSFADVRAPRGVPSGDIPFEPGRTPPAESSEWPVALGRLRRTRESPEKPWAYSVVPSARPYAGLVGEAIVAPSGRARVQVGAEQPDNPRRFAVFMQDPASPALPVAPALAIEADGKIELRGDATIHGDLTMDGGAIAFEVGPARARQARPWQIYRHVETGPAQGPPAPSGDAAKEASEELRIEMQGGGKGLNRVVIGAWSVDTNTFAPCLTIADDCTVTVHGDLIVEGMLEETLKSPEAQVTQAAQNAGLASVISLISSSAVAEATRSHTGDIDTVDRLLASEVGKQAMVGMLAANQTRGKEFARIMLRNTEARKIVIAEQVADATARRKAADALIADPDGQSAIVAGLFDANQAARDQILRPLVENDVGLESIARGMANSADPTRRATRLVELLRALGDPGQVVLAALKAALADNNGGPDVVAQA